MKDNSIKAGELRLGNWVMADEPIQIDSITGNVINPYKDTIYSDKTATHYLLSTIRPIPLTAEVLEKCGFEYINLPSNFNVGNGGYRKLIMSSAQRYILLTGRSHFICGMYDSDDVKYYSPLTDFSYMHQLQNLYFALTGKELEITL